MSKKYSGPKTKPRKGGTIALRVFAIIFLVLIIACGLLLFVPQLYDLTLGHSAVVNILSTFSTYVNARCQRILGFQSSFASYGTYQTGLIEAYGLITSALILIYFFFKALTLMGYLKRTNKKGRPFRYILLTLIAIVNFAVAIGFLLVCFQNKLGNFGTQVATYYSKVVNKAGSLLTGNEVLTKIYTFNGNISTAASFLIYTMIVLILVNIIWDLLVTAGRKHPRVSKSAVLSEAPVQKGALSTPAIATQNESEETLLVGALSSTPLAKEDKPKPEGMETNLVGNVTKTEIIKETVKVVEPDAVMDGVRIEPIAPVEKKDELGQPLPTPTEPAPVEKIVPTRRELAVLNMLEPFNLSVVPELPGIYKTDINKVVADLEPERLQAASFPADSQTAQGQNAFRENANQREVLVLPGVDEWNADPWSDVKPESDSESPLINLPHSLETPVDVTELARKQKEEARRLAEEEARRKAEEEARRQAEEEARRKAEEEARRQAEEEARRKAEEERKAKEEAERLAREEEERKAKEEAERLAAEEAAKKAEEERLAKEEAERLAKEEEERKAKEEAERLAKEEEERKAKEEADRLAAEEEAKRKAEAEEIEKRLLEEEARRKAEEERLAAEEAERLAREEEERKAKEEEARLAREAEEARHRSEPIPAESHTNNDHEEIETQPVAIDNDWKLPEYVEEPEQPAEEEKPAEEIKPVEEVKKPVASVKQVAPLTPKFRPDADKPTIIAPITPIKPVEEEKPAEEPVEEKKVAPIAGPMHAINKAAKKDIKPVEAKKVKFDLKKYQVKTYSGSLTAAEAFNLGVTKVQPTVVPVMANQDENESSWKTRRREEEIRKNGYVDITTVQDLTPVKQVSKGPDLTKATSIRDLVKAHKAANEEAEVAPVEEETNKPAKPIAPIKPVEPVKKEEEAVEEKPEETPAVKPIAVAPLTPIKKPSNGPKPKPIAPIKPVNPKK